MVKVSSMDEMLGFLYARTYFQHVFGTCHVVWTTENAWMKYEKHAMMNMRRQVDELLSNLRYTELLTIRPWTPKHLVIDVGHTNSKRLLGIRMLFNGRYFASL